MSRSTGVSAVPPRRVGARCLLLSAALLAGCSATAPAAVPTAHISPGGPAVVAVGTVGDAEALVFANRYDDATRAFATLVALRPDDPAVHAARALFLSYRQQPDEALGEAQRAVALGPDSGRAFAVLCRVDDWSNRLDEAVSAGHTAVALAAADVRGHLFLSEALADHGDLDAARAELEAARHLLGPTSGEYERAEVHREEANLDRDAGDPGAAVAAFRAAESAQPGWAERATDLASSYLENGDPEQAQAALDRAARLSSADSGLLATVGRVSLLQSAYAGAQAAYGTLLTLRPRDPQVLELNAQTAMADRHEADAAIALLERALDADPGDEEAAAYLLYLERNVHHDGASGLREIADAVAAAGDDARPGRTISPPDVDAVEAEHAGAALAAVNAVRAQGGLPPVFLDARLSQSAVNHCFYWLFNNADPSVAKLGIHRETRGLPGFTGVRAGDRDLAVGYVGGEVGEDITHRGGAAAAVRDWVDSVYHRFPILRADLTTIGYGDCAVGPLPMEDMEFSFDAGGGSRQAPVLFPAPAQTGVPTSFFDNELPDPVPAGQPRTTGYPVTVTFDANASVQVTSFRLLDPDGGGLTAYLLYPQASTENSASLLPVKPLRPATTYTARLSATVDGIGWQRTWSFTTAPSAP